VNDATPRQAAAAFKPLCAHLCITPDCATITFELRCWRHRTSSRCRDENDVEPERLETSEHETEAAVDENRRLSESAEFGQITGESRPRLQQDASSGRRPFTARYPRR
jgi:hypothetical protein